MAAGNPIWILPKYSKLLSSKESESGLFYENYKQGRGRYSAKIERVGIATTKRTWALVASLAYKLVWVFKKPMHGGVDTITTPSKVTFPTKVGADI